MDSRLASREARLKLQSIFLMKSSRPTLAIAILASLTITGIAREKTTLMWLGGEPLGERYIWWNFVSSRKERIEQAKADWKEGRILLPPTDNVEFVPLPADRSKPAGPAPQALS